jgi:PAS domain S-box-containing protein
MNHARELLHKTMNKKVRNKTRIKPRKPVVQKKEDVQKLVELLQVHQVELEHQNQELKIVEEELEVSRNKYVNLFDFSPIPLFVLDLEGSIKGVNLCASTMLGFDRNKLLGKHFIAYIPIAERDVYKSFMTIVFSSPVKQSCELNIMNKDKRIFHVRLEARELTDTLESDRTCQVALIDLTK